MDDESGESTDEDDMWQTYGRASGSESERLGRGWRSETGMLQNGNVYVLIQTNFTRSLSHISGEGFVIGFGRTPSCLPSMYKTAVNYDAKLTKYGFAFCHSTPLYWTTKLASGEWGLRARTPYRKFAPGPHYETSIHKPFKEPPSKSSCPGSAALSI